MHTTVIKTKEDGRWVVHHNGDYSGDVLVQINTYHPNMTIESRVEFFDNSAIRARMQPLIHDPIEDIPPDYYQVSIPFEVMAELVANKVRSEMISRIEDMNKEDILRELIRR